MAMGLPRSVTLTLLFLFMWRGGEAATLTFVNRCGDTVWPGVLSNAGSARLGTTGFELAPGAARAVSAPSGWSGRLWARTGCAQDGATGRLVCATGDCGSGSAECGGAGAAPPATLAEFTLGAGGGLDFYDVSLVDGYNLPLLVEPSGNGGSGMSCAPAGCVADLNAMCPAELRAHGGAACRSACDAFRREEYCCSGAYATPAACRPSAYSQVFKVACPRSYSYAFDDPTSTFTCAASPDYTVTFCPAGATPSQKSTTTPTPATTATPTMMPGTAVPGATPTTVPGATPTMMPGTAMPGATPTMMPGTATPGMMPGTSGAATTSTMPGTTFTDANPEGGGSSMPMPMGAGGGQGEQGVMLTGSVSWMANMATGDTMSSAAVATAATKLSGAAPFALVLLHLLLRR